MKEYLIASDFDQTLSFRDSGIILSEILGVSGFEPKIAGLSNVHLVQQGGELDYLGDGSSHVHVMLHVNRREGLTIAVSENKYITQIAKRTILSDDALSVLIPILEDVAGWESTRIRALYESQRFVLQEGEKVRRDSLTIAKASSPQVVNA